MKMQRRYSKRELLGQLHVDYLFSADKLAGITPESTRWEILGAFLKAGEARAERLVETDGGFIVLQSIPHRPDSGAIYAFNESLRAFFWLRFDEKEDTLNSIDFQNALRVYNLFAYAAVLGGPRRRHRPVHRRRKTAVQRTATGQMNRPDHNFNSAARAVFD
jgi:hypothetical protein